jgi:hypothetical protein
MVASDQSLSEVMIDAGPRRLNDAAFVFRNVELARKVA